MSLHFRRLEAAAREVARRRTTASSAQRAARDRLKQWQADRLAREHADLLASPRFGAAARFFLEDLYGAKDFAHRDAQVARILPTLKRFLPESALAAIADAVELDALSERLDSDLADRLAAGPLADSDYEQAYRSAYCEQSRQLGLPDPREQQIDLVAHIGRQLDALVKQPLLGSMLKSMRLPAKAAGLAELHDFLSRGFSAFKAMKGAQEFLERIGSAERARHRDMLSGH